jgi:hypothetical protein
VYVKGIGWEGVEWIYVADDKYNRVACCAYGIKYGEFLE